MVHGTFDSNKMYFILIPLLIEYGRELAKITAKSKKKKIIDKDRYFISNFKIECAKTFLIKFC